MVENIKCTLETRHSEKSGKDYQVIVIKLTENVEKIVFPDSAELELLRLAKEQKQK